MNSHEKVAPDSKKAKTAAQTIFDIIDHPSKANPLSDDGTDANIEGDIELKDIHFVYPSRVEWVHK